MESCKKLRNHLAASFLAVILMTVPALAAIEATTLDSVATVNGIPITRERFNQETDRASQQISRQGQPVPEEMKKMVQERVLDFLIGEELLHQKAVTKGIAVSDEKVAEEISGVTAKFGSEEKFKAALNQMNVSEAKVEEDIRRGLAIQELVQQEVVSKVTVSEEEIKKFYDENRKLFTKQAQVKASHILIKVDADADEAEKAEAKAKIDKAAQRIKDGEDFAAVAGEVSEGPSKTKGGDLGYFERGQMVTPFDEVAFTMEPGQVSGVVETNFGYHIIKVFDRQEASTATFEEVEPQIADHLKQEKSKVAVQEYIETLKADATIETYI
jgi:peptidyl-prolyl cis-trans isomerase C